MAVSREELELILRVRDQMSAQLQKAEGAASSFGGALSKVATIAGGMLAAAGVQSLVGNMQEMIHHASEIPSIATSFEALGGSISVMREGAAGMVGDVELMKSFNTAAQLVSRDFAQTLPGAMKYLEQVAGSTGMSVEYLLNSLVTGVGRLQPMILDNLAIQVDLTKAYEDYAKAAGKSVDDLNKQEQQMAVMNQTMELLKRNTEGMPDVTGSAVQEFAKLHATFENIRNEIGVALLPVFRAIVGAVQQILPVIQDMIPALEEMGQKFGDALGSPEMQAALQDMVTQLADALPQLVPLVMSLANELIRAFGDPAVQEGMMSFTSGIVNLIALLGTVVPKVTEVTSAVKGSSDAWEYLGFVTGGAWVKLAVGLPVGIAWIDNLRGIKDESQEAAAATGELSFASEDVLFAMMDAAAGAKEAGAGVLSSADGWIQLRGKAESASKGIAKAWGEVAEALKDTAVTDALHEMNEEVEEIMTDMAQALVDISQDGFDEQRAVWESSTGELSQMMAQYVTSLEEMAFQHNVRQAQEEQVYQSKRQVLLAAGRADDVANLDAKHAESQSMSERDFSIRQQMEERALIQQQITQVNAYIEQIKAQQKKVRETLTLKLMESKEFQKLNVDEQLAVLNIIDKGAAEKFKLQKKADEASVKVAAFASAGRMDLAAKEAQAYLDIMGADAAEAVRLAELRKKALEDQFRNFKIDMPAISMAAFDHDLQATMAAEAEKGAKAAKQATEPATRALSEVVRQVDDGIKAAKSAIKELLRFEIPEGVDEGLDKFGEFVTLAVNKIYALFEDPEIDLKRKVDSFKKHIGPAADALRFISTKLGVETLKEMPDLSLWQQQARQFFLVAFEFLSWVVAEYGTADTDDAPTALERVAGAVSDTVSVLSIIKTDLEAVRPLRGDFGELARRYVQQIGVLTENLLVWLTQLHDEGAGPALTKAASLVDDVAAMFKLLTDLDKFNAGKPDWAERLHLYLRRARLYTDDVVAWITDLEQRHTAEVLVKTAAIVEHVASLTDLLHDLDAFNPGGPGWTNRFLTYMSQLKFAVEQIRRYLQEDILDGELDLSIEAASGVVDGVKELTSILGLSLDIKMPSASLLKDLPEFLRIVMEAAQAITMWALTPFPLSGMNQQVYESEAALLYEWFEAAAEIVNNISSVLGILDATLQVNMPRHGWDADLGDFLTGVIEAAKEIVHRLHTPFSSLGGITNQQVYEQELALLYKWFADLAPVVADIAALLDILSIDLSINLPDVSPEALAKQASDLMGMAIGAAVAIMKALSDPDAWGLAPARSAEGVKRQKEKIAELREQVQNSVEFLGALSSMLDILGADLSIKMPDVSVGQLQARVKRFMRLVIGAVVAIQKELTDPDAWGLARATDAAGFKWQEEKMAEMRHLIQESVGDVDGILKLVSLLGAKLDFDLPKFGFGKKVAQFVSFLMVAVTELLEGVRTIADDPQWEGRLEELAEAAGQLMSVVGVIDVANMFADIQLKRPPPSQIKSIIEDMFIDLMDVIPDLRTGLREVMDAWTAEMEDGISLEGGIDAVAQLQDMFAGIRDMVDAMGAIVSMSTSQDGKGAVLPPPGALKATLQKIRAMVTNALPEIEQMATAFDRATEAVDATIDKALALLSSLHELAGVIAGVSGMSVDTDALSAWASGVSGALGGFDAAAGDAGLGLPAMGGTMPSAPTPISLTLNGVITVETYFDGEKYVTHVEAGQLFNEALAEMAAMIP